MPGIVGLITRMPRELATRELLRMVSALEHEDFYTAGVVTEESLGVYVGWVARKGSFSDGMPLRNEKGDALLVFSGEEFPDASSIDKLRVRGHKFDSRDASHLIHVYEDDESFPASLNGRFHGLVADRATRTVILFNDRYGMQRVCYHQSKDAFYFAAEEKAILCVRPELRRLDARSAGEFIACGCTLGGRSLFEDIHVLPGAAKWVFRDAHLEQKGSYFDATLWEQQEPLEPDGYYAELRDSFRQNLPKYFRSSERIAMSLTGGLDTRMIMAWQNSQPGSLACYTFGGMSRECKDVTVAREVARACGQFHEAIGIKSEFLVDFSRYAERTVYLTDGRVDVSRAPDLYLGQRARDIAPVRMTGLYGGEVLRGRSCLQSGGA